MRFIKNTNTDDNWLGYDVVEIVEFNFDGAGNALVRIDDEVLSAMAIEDLNLVLCGRTYETPHEAEGILMYKEERTHGNPHRYSR